MDSLKKVTRYKYKNDVIGCLSCCILLVWFQISNPELYASTWGRVETGVLENDKTIQVSTVATFDEVMRRFNETSPNRSIKPKCLQGPQRTRPTVFLSLGRSGSTVICAGLNAMTNSHSDSLHVEYVGRNHKDTLYFFDTTIPVKDKFEKKGMNNIPSILNKHAEKKDVPGLNNSKHGEWLVNHMCRLQQKYPDDLVGFKWKPNLTQFMERKEARETLQLVASLAAKALKDEPPIVFLRSRRNMLDVALSSLKHRQHEELHPHCHTGDEACIKEHQQRLFVSDVQLFFNKVHSGWQKENIIDKVLVSLKIPHVSVSYETLFYPDQIVNGEEEWNSMFQFISPGARRVSWEEIQGAMPFASTSLFRNHTELIENWEEVYDVFRGTEVEHLFRLSD